MVLSALYAHTTTDTFGQPRRAPAGNGASANAAATAVAAGLRVRARSTRPNAQSSTA